jgi:hypothetical protein
MLARCDMRNSDDDQLLLSQALQQSQLLLLPTPVAAQQRQQLINKALLTCTQAYALYNNVKCMYRMCSDEQI